MRNKVNRLLLVLAVLAMAVTPAFAAEEGGDPLSALGINGGFLLSQWINFGLVFGLLTVMLWRPMMNFLDARSAKIQKGIEDATAAANARRNAEAEAEKIIAQARKEAAQLATEGQSRGEEASKSVAENARKEAEKIVADARTASTAARDAELAGLRGQVTAIASAIAQRMIGESLDEKRQKKLVSEFLSDVPASAKGLKGEAEVVSAMPLDKDEQDKVSKAIGADSVTFRVDPSILGGLIIRSGGRVVDGSVRNNLSTLSSRLN
jgi:F-type H+-transporting ATPase subunit b